eukprot:TRINITY_DN32903_c0_g1_i1.p1 TRINITY_DN32903_c0_g1~~TRINITY_DN32903_c0_g1_i1.p1  ORF type:complete len:710 (-),score=113.32 TRINITY_DN32903_c0_g1_i1:12-2141(-)
MALSKTTRSTVLPASAIPSPELAVRRIDASGSHRCVGSSISGSVRCRRATSSFRSARTRTSAESASLLCTAVGAASAFTGWRRNKASKVTRQFFFQKKSKNAATNGETQNVSSVAEKADKTESAGSKAAPASKTNVVDEHPDTTKKPSNFLERVMATAPGYETAQDRVFHWLGRAPKPGSECFQALKKYFPGALPGAAVHLRSRAILEQELGMTPENTLLGTSFCPDEINNHRFDIGTLMRDYWGNVFPMGGIGGPPYVGETGFKAFSSHVSKDGNIIVIFGPHVGVSATGEVGQYLHDGQPSTSSACGAIIGAYKAAMSDGGSSPSHGGYDTYDMQMDEIKEEFARHATGISEEENPMAACAYLAYEMVKDRMLQIVNTDFGSGKLVLIGGMQINMPHSTMEDHFLPLMFEVRRKGEPTRDLMEHFSDLATQSDLSLAPWAAKTAQREVFAWMTWSPPAVCPVYKAMHKYFPGALPSQALHERKRAILQKYGIEPKNTIMGTSLCPDEINNEVTDVPVLMQSYWGEVFPMGGISGAPFVGKTGFKAFSSHVPDDGNIVILFGPHVGIDESGEIGKCLRQGQRHTSSACGAVIGAYKACLNSDAPLVVEPGSYDRQMDWIKAQLAPHVQSISRTDNPMAALAHQSYIMVKDKLEHCVNNDFGSGYMCLIGGIQINLPEGLEDHFLPYTFELRKAGEPTVDLINELREFQ